MLASPLAAYLPDILWNAAPAFSGAFVGVLLGVPLALRFTRVMRAAEQRSRKKEQARLLIPVLEVLQQTVVFNNGRLKSFLKSQAAGEWVCDAGLRDGTLGALGDDLNNLLSNAEMRVEIVHYYSRLQAFGKLNDAYLQMTLMPGSFGAEAEKARHIVSARSCELAELLQGEGRRLELQLEGLLCKTRQRSKDRPRDRWGRSRADSLSTTKEWGPVSQAI